MNEWPSMTIVTPCLNQGKYIQETIESVLGQEYPDVSHIVRDGGSTDNTIEILKSYKHLQWFSERDAGQADAINKGFRRATGEIVAWINSDDCYVKGALNRVGIFFRENPDVDVLYGDCYMTNERSDVLRVRREIDFYPDVLLYGFNYIPQPSTFFRRRIVEKAGDLDIRLKYSMDYEYFLRLWKLGARFHHMAQFLSNYRLHPRSVTFTQPEGIAAEYRAIRKKYVESHFALRAGVFAILHGYHRAKRQMLKITQGIQPDLWPFDWEVNVRRFLKKV